MPTDFDQELSSKDMPLKLFKNKMNELIWNESNLFSQLEW